MTEEERMGIQNTIQSIQKRLDSLEERKEQAMDKSAEAPIEWLIEDLVQRICDYTPDELVDNYEILSALAGSIIAFIKEERARIAGAIGGSKRKGNKYSKVK